MLSCAFIYHSLQIDSAHVSWWVCLTLKESVVTAAVDRRKQLSTPFFCHRHKRTLSVSALGPSFRLVSTLLISLFPRELRNAYIHSSHRLLLSHPRLPRASVLLNYFALLSRESSQSALKTWDSWHLSSLAQQLPDVALLFFCTLTHHERHELLERESEISEGGRRYF